jgi:hypothetical protein
LKLILEQGGHEPTKDFRTPDRNGSSLGTDGTACAVKN